MVLPPMYPRSPPTAGRNLEFCQSGENLPTNVDQLVQSLPQVLHVGGIDPTIFIGGFGVLVQIVAAHLQEICHALQFFQVEVQAIAVQCHLADILCVELLGGRADHLRKQNSNWANEGYFPDKICSWRAAGTDFDSSGDSEKAVHPLRWEETS